MAGCTTRALERAKEAAGFPAALRQIGEGARLARAGIPRPAQLACRAVRAAQHQQQLTAFAPRPDAETVGRLLFEHRRRLVRGGVGGPRLEPALPPREHELLALRPPLAEHGGELLRRRIAGPARLRGRR